MFLFVVLLQFLVILLQTGQFLVNMVLLAFEVVLVALDLVLLLLELDNAGGQVVQVLLGEQDATIQVIRGHIRASGRE